MKAHYQLQQTAFGHFTRYHIQSPDGQNAFSIIPEKGATLLDLTLGGVSVLDGYQTPDELSAGKWGKSAILFPFPNRLNKGRYSWQGIEYGFPINSPATENAIHGFVRTEAFTVERIDLREQEAKLVCRYDYNGKHTFYPFPFTLRITFQLSDKNTLNFKVGCTNRHHAPIPVGFGWHPYFRLAPRADQHTMRLPACARVDIDDRMIPTGVYHEFEQFRQFEPLQETTFDNCFASDIGGQYRLQMAFEEHTLSVQANAAQFPFFQVFTPPHRESVALEPMSCNIDAFNNGDGLYILHPNEDWKGKIVVQIS